MARRRVSLSPLLAQLGRPLEQVAFMMQNPESMLADRWSYAQFVNGRQAALAKLAGRVVCVYCTKPTLHDADEIFAHQQQMYVDKIYPSVHHAEQASGTVARLCTRT
jgi:hypothetical protein